MNYNKNTKKTHKTSGKPLENTDTLFMYKNERDIFLPVLRYIYGIEFQERIDFVESLSLTSQKCILYDEKGNKYFLKKKPNYSLEEPLKSRSIILQTMLSQKTNYVPPIIKTNDNLSYGCINQNFYLLTPYIQGDLFKGRIEQSIECASKLGQIHDHANKHLTQTEIPVDSTQSVMTFLGYAQNMESSNKDLKEKVLDMLKYKISKYVSKNLGRMGWIHSDYTPFNIIFSGDRIVAVNDFDNATFGNISKDVAECLISHCDINYNGPTSFLNKAIRTSIDEHSMKLLLDAYMNNSDIEINDLIDLPNEMSLMWLKLMILGILRGDYAYEDIYPILDHSDKLNVAGNNLLQNSH